MALQVAGRLSLSEKAFLKRYLILILLTVVFTRLAGIGFVAFTEVLTLAEIIAIFRMPGMVAFNILSILFFGVYFYLYARPISRWMVAPTTALGEIAMRRVRYFPWHFWGVFLLILLLAPSLVMWHAEQHAGIVFGAQQQLQIRLISLTVFILIGLPLFFLLLDLFGRALPGMIRQTPHLTLRSKILLISGLMPLLVSVILVQYFWARTGYFSLEMLWVWLGLLLVVVAGMVLFLRGYKQSLAPLQNLLAQNVEYGQLELSTLVSQSNDEIGILVNEYRRLLERHVQAEASLEKETQRALVTLQSIGDGVITTDIHGIVEYLNPVAERLLDKRSSEVIGKHYLDILNMEGESDGETLHDLVEMILHHDSATVHADDGILRHADGSEFSINISAASMRAGNGQIVGVVLVLHDITEVMNMARQLGHQASHDMLTGLYNRREFERRLDAAIRESHANHTHHVLFYMDLDQFKVVNDTYGHRAGDELLRQLSRRFGAAIREHDVLARPGGDEFGILLYDCPLDKASEIAESIRQQVRNFRFSWDDRVFEIGISIGVVPLDANSGSMVDVMSYADAACYVAKDAGRNRVHLYSSDDKAVARHHREMEWIHRIHDAFEENRFVLYYQPIVPVRPGCDASSHGEVLMRMLDDKGDPISPMQFIPAAERYNLMPIIDRWVVRTVLGKMREAQGPAESPPLHCSINLSGQSLNDEHFLDFVLSNIHESDVAGDYLCFEITETAAITNLGRAHHFIDTLKQMGCYFALDDFGSGLSSFAYLKGLKVDYLKIDGAFIKDITDDTVDRAMVDSINQIGHVMGLKTIAEFVENEAILSVLKRLGVDYAQGYGIARPMPLDEVVANLNHPSAMTGG